MKACLLQSGSSRVGSSPPTFNATSGWFTWGRLPANDWMVQKLINSPPPTISPTRSVTRTHYDGRSLGRRQPLPNSRFAIANVLEILRRAFFVCARFYVCLCLVCPCVCVRALMFFRVITPPGAPHRLPDK